MDEHGLFRESLFWRPWFLLGGIDSQLIQLLFGFQLPYGIGMEDRKRPQTVNTPIKYNVFL